MASFRSMTNQAPDCEASLISCLVQGVDDWAVTPDLFNRTATRLIYDAYVEKKKANEPIDAITLYERVAPHVEYVEFSAIIHAAPTTLHYPTFLRDARLALAKRKRQYLALMLNDGCTHEDMRRLFKDVVTLEEIAALEAPKKLERYRFDSTRTPPDIRAIYTLKGKIIGSAGNICVIAAKAKAGKTAQIGGMIASTTGLPGDTLGVRGPNPHGHAVILLDTEQSEADFYKVCNTAFRRVNVSPPDWFWGYSMVPLSIAERRESLRSVLAMARRQLGGVHSVFLDGVADFVSDPNDAEECFDYIADLHRLAIQYDTAIYCVLHFNPGDNFKMRGHLGSQLERKAEVNLALDKNADGVTKVYTATSRRAPIFKSEAPQFSWSDAAGMHMTWIGQPKAQKHHADGPEF